MAQSMTPAKVAAAAAKAEAKALDEAPPVADPVHSILASIVGTLEMLAEATPGAHMIQSHQIAGLKAALAALTAPPK